MSKMSEIDAEIQRAEEHLAKLRKPKTPPNLFDASRDLYDACLEAMIVITDLCRERGFTTEARLALTKITEAVREADGDLNE